MKAIEQQASPEVRLAELERAVQQLQVRVAELERKASGGRAARREREPEAGVSRQERMVLTRENLESLVGGTLLNRVGIVVLLLAAAYFLKYSFDNRWIGELGRVVIGFVAGGGLLAWGDYLVRRRYALFAQGISGGGIGVLYLSTYAAAHLYGLISPAVAFALYVLAALAGALLASRQRAYAVAVLSVAAGFLAPFLLGRQAAGALALLGYAAVIDLGVVYLAGHRNWRSLNLLAFVGTMVTVVAARGLVPPEVPWYILQLFLGLYFVLFGAIAFWYNVWRGSETRTLDVVLLVANGMAFFSLTYQHLAARFPSWMGPAAIALAALYLGVALGLRRSGRGDNLLFLSLLGTGLAFVTVAVPIQLQERWVAVAWLVEASVLVLAGVRGGNVWVRSAGLALLTTVALGASTQYVHFPQPPLPLLNERSLTLLLAALGFVLASVLYGGAAGLAPAERLLSRPAGLAALLLGMAYLAWEVGNAVLRYHLPSSPAFAVSLAWGVLALGLVSLGWARDLKGVRVAALALFAATTFKVLVFDLGALAVGYRVLILLIVGAMLLAVSFGYQRRGRD
ncbi:MAG: DUF2339 domain-containing protein [Syntrophomonadaceae bacterium]|nr:DUF2339 domain-containing protein [Syntrophomonadaceae bacterium]